MEKPSGIVEIRDFPGLILELDEYDLPPGASPLQINATSEDMGVLRSRLGYRVVSFESEV